jgi:hypothetical protein
MPEPPCSASDPARYVHASPNLTHLTTQKQKHESCHFVCLNSIHLVAHDNRIYVPGKSMQVHLCNTAFNESSWLALGWIDKGTQVFDVATADMIIAWARPLLGI